MSYADIGRTSAPTRQFGPAHRRATLWIACTRRVFPAKPNRRSGHSTRSVAAVAGRRSEVFLQLMYRIEHFTLERAWTELTDDEFFWEPTPSTWSIRPREECRTSTPFGDGDWLVDFEIPEPTPAPMTSIAWLFWHIGSVGRLVDIDILGGRRTMASGWTSPYLTHHPIFTNAAAATTALRNGWADVRAAIEGTTDEQFEIETPRYTYAAAPMKDGLCVLGPPRARPSGDILRCRDAQRGEPPRDPDLHAARLVRRTPGVDIVTQSCRRIQWRRDGGYSDGIPRRIRACRSRRRVARGWWRGR